MANSNPSLVKCLNTSSSSRKRFVFKSFSQRVEEINIDVFRNLDPVKAEPTTGSSFFRETLVQWRELNTAEDFITIYEKMMPFVQTLPQIILHREKIFLGLIQRLNIKAKLSLEPILVLISSLSRDILEEFLPFLERLAKSVVDLLEEGGDRDPEILEQVFTSWSNIMMYLQKYFVKNVIHILKITVRLRFYHKDYVREFMAEVVSFLLRNSPIDQLLLGLRKVVREVAKNPSVTRREGVTALLWHVMRGTTNRLHSRADKVFRFLLDKNTLCINDKYPNGSRAIIEVITGLIHRLFNEIEERELGLIYNSLFDEIKNSINSGCLEHLNYMIALLSFSIRNSIRCKSLEKEVVLKLIQLLVDKYIVPSDNMETDNHLTQVIDSILQLLISLLDFPLIKADLARILPLYAPVFQLKSSSLLDFIKELLAKDPQFSHTFQSHIISTTARFIVVSPEQVLFILLTFLEREKKSPVSRGTEEGGKKICDFFKSKLSDWAGRLNNLNNINNNLSDIKVSENDAAVLWGVIRCFSHVANLQDGFAIRDLISSLDKLMVNEAGNAGGIPRSTWQSLIGAALESYCELIKLDSNKTNEEIEFFLSLAERNKSSAQVLLAVADFFDSLLGEKGVLDINAQNSKADPFGTFAENLGCSSKAVRVSTLRILSHFVPRERDLLANDEPPNKRLKTEDSTSANEDTKSTNVIDLLLSIETAPLSISTSRGISILISRVQMSLSSGRFQKEHVQLALHGILGVLHNRFSQLWGPTLDCLSLLIRKHRDIVWEKFVEYLAFYQSKTLCSEDLSAGSGSDTQPHDLASSFNRFACTESDSTPLVTVAILLLQSLQKIPEVSESRSRQLVPLFFNFLGYSNDNISSVESYTPDRCNGKEWRLILKEWLNLIKSMHNARSLYRSDALHKVLSKRLLNDLDPDIQLKVLDCLLNWKEESFVPYIQHIRNLVDSKNLREELTTWSVSRESGTILEGHRGNLVPLIIRLLTPKVRNLKSLGSRKHESVSHRKALLRFFLQFDPNELELFFALLLKSLLPHSLLIEIFDSVKPLSAFVPKITASITVNHLSFKRINGFLHVIEDIFGNFDADHIRPYLDPLLMIVVGVLESCMRNLTGEIGGSDQPDGDLSLGDLESDTSAKQLKDLRTLCLRTVSSALTKYETHNFASDLWDKFFNSMRPLILNFKQEGASSEKPSSLFLCFISMSRSPNLAGQLGREPSLVPTMFSILTVGSASDAIVSSVLDFTENLLRLDCDFGLDSVVGLVLLPHVDCLVWSLRDFFRARNESQRKHAALPGQRELRILKMLVKYIKDPVIAGQFLDILLPFFKRKGQNFDECMEGLRVIEGMIPIIDSETSEKIIGAISLLLVTAGLDLRLCICQLVQSLASRNSSFALLSGLLRDLNAVSAAELGEPDYDKRIEAYESIGPHTFSQMKEEHCTALLSHCVYDMSSDELIFRQSASRALQSFLKFAAGILNADVAVGLAGDWTKVSVKQLVERIFLHYIGEAMVKDISVQKEWFCLFREMVSSFENYPSLNLFRPLCNDQDPEQDFFTNIIHLQVHRRVKALSLFRNTNKGNFSEVLTMKIFVPWLFNMLLEVKELKNDSLTNACTETLASIASHIQWENYRSILTKCFRELTLKPDKQKLLLRLICSVLDSYHFSKEDSNNNNNNILQYLEKSALPQARKLLSLDPDKVNVTSCVVILKVLKLLPAELMESQLSSVVHRICTFLKNRLESVRNEARSALVACLKELGDEYLLFIVKILQAILKRGYELHVLGYTLNYLLSKSLINGARPVSLDYCLDELLEIVKTDLFGDVAEEKEVGKIASKMKETKKTLSFDTLLLISRRVNFRESALKLLSPFQARMSMHLTPKVKLRIEKALHNLSLGLESNPSADTPDVLIFTYGLIEETLPNTTPNSHLITVFALGLLVNRLKSKKLRKKDLDLLSMLDPFVPLLSECLRSKFELVISSTFKCLTHLIQLTLPSLEPNSGKIKTALLEIVHRTGNPNGPLIHSCLSLLSLLMHHTKVSLSDEELRLVVNSPVFIDLQTNPNLIALSLLGSIIRRKLSGPEIYDLVTRVGELMVTVNEKHVQKKCAQILLRFLKNYEMSKNRFQQHLDFLLANLSYEHPTGRDSVLEMLHAIVEKFPEEVIDQQARPFFLHLVAALANETDSGVRSSLLSLVQQLAARASPDVSCSLLEYCVSWYTGDDRHLWAASAQVLGLLAGVPTKAFRKHLDRLLLVAKRIMESSVSTITDVKKFVFTEEEAKLPFWKEAYYSLLMLQKLLDSFPNLYSVRDTKEIWVLTSKLLVHPHILLRDISIQLVASYFNDNKNNDNKNNNLYLLESSQLFVLATSFLHQLRMGISEESKLLAINNISFSICELHLFARERKLLGFWSELDKIGQETFLEGFELLGSRKARDNFLLCTTSNTTSTTGVEREIHQVEREEADLQSLLVMPLLQRMGKIAMQMGDLQMEVVFKSFEIILRRLGSEDSLAYTTHMLFPLYKVCEDFAGKVVSDGIKQIAGEVRDKMRGEIGIEKFLHVYNHIRKSLKSKRESRKQSQKLLAVINPMRLAKQKLRVAAKHRVHKRRKLMAMKMGRWRR